MKRSTSSGGRRTRPTAHELARYEALFAARTRAMKSSAMRDMMALTERPDVISGLIPGLLNLTTILSSDCACRRFQILGRLLRVSSSTL